MAINIIVGSAARSRRPIMLTRFRRLLDFELSIAELIGIGLLLRPT
jgi:hypothetical protein